MSHTGRPTSRWDKTKDIATNVWERTKQIAIKVKTPVLIVSTIIAGASVGVLIGTTIKLPALSVLAVTLACAGTAGALSYRTTCKQQAKALEKAKKKNDYEEDEARNISNANELTSQIHRLVITIEKRLATEDAKAIAEDAKAIAEDTQARIDEAKTTKPATKKKQHADDVLRRLETRTREAANNRAQASAAAKRTRANQLKELQTLKVKANHLSINSPKPPLRKVSIAIQSHSSDDAIPETPRECIKLTDAIDIVLSTLGGGVTGIVSMYGTITGGAAAVSSTALATITLSSSAVALPVALTSVAGAIFYSALEAATQDEEDDAKKDYDAHRQRAQQQQNEHESSMKLLAKLAALQSRLGRDIPADEEKMDYPLLAPTSESSPTPLSSHSSTPPPLPLRRKPLEVDDVKMTAPPNHGLGLRASPAIFADRWLSQHQSPPTTVRSSVAPAT